MPHLSSVVDCKILYIIASIPAWRKALRGEKPYVAKRLNGLGVSNLHYITTDADLERFWDAREL